ncbi:hypothetical protein [Arthrobacter psychrochitiniphilus]|uniref:hypothetical protein n=1 Tax=Arthrobacter psychrochitiniphilus TaxID=291045 RepID=UPI003F7B54B9
MNPHQLHVSGQENTPGEKSRRVSKLPGMRVAGVAFVLTLGLGAGGIAVANWNQSAMTTIDITAGAAPAPSPTPSASPTPSPTRTAAPTPSPTPTAVPTQPPAVDAGTGTIVVNPAIRTLPAMVDAGTMSCESSGSSGRVDVSWEGKRASNISYMVTLKSQTSQTVFLQTQTVTAKNASFSLGNTNSSYGNYLLRIQPVNTATGAVGDPSYRTMRYFGKNNFGCDYGAANVQPPLGALVLRSEPPASRPNDNVLKLSWTPSEATSYVVTLVLSGSTPKYGTEFTTSNLGTTLVFPPRSYNQAGTSVSNAAFFGQYSLRILPMDGSQAGDPVYKTVQYGQYDFSVW